MAVGAALALLSACVHASPAEQAKKDAERLISSAATMRMTVDAWRSGAVPAAFASSILRQVEESLRKEPRMIASHALRTDARTVLLDAIRSMTESLRAMRSSVAGSTPAALDPQLARLAHTERALLALTRANGAS